MRNKRFYRWVMIFCIYFNVFLQPNSATKILSVENTNSLIDSEKNAPNQCNPNPICKDEVNGVILLRINTSDPRITIGPGIANGSYKDQIRDIVTQRGAVLGVNADYFNCTTSNCWMGATWRDGNYLAPNTIYERTWPVRSNLRLSKSKSMGIGLGQDYQSDEWWNAIAGGPYFIRGGSFRWEGPTYYGSGGDRKVIINDDHFDAPTSKGTQWFEADYAARMTAAGFNGSTLVLAVSNNGISNRNMATLLIEQGVRDAIRYDSGGSTQMYSKYPGATVDLRSNDNDRAIANGLIVYFNPNAPMPTPIPTQPCPAPSLNNPTSGTSFSSSNITFRWSNPNCGNGYTFRIKTVPDMNNGGETVDARDIFNSTEQTINLDSRWQNRDLYWSVTARKEANGGILTNWASANQFSMNLNQRPSIAFNTSNGNGAADINAITRDWTFSGTASDPEGQLNRVEIRCSGDNCGSGTSSTSGNSWSLARNGMLGLNQVSFVAYDNQNQASDPSRSVTLRIDLAAPTTRLNVNGNYDPNSWNKWLTAPAAVRLEATDNATGNARVGVKEVRYRIDGGSEQVANGANTSFNIGDGTHSVSYYAIDLVNNTEANQGIALPIRVDTIAPSEISGIRETHNLLDNVWQNTINVPSFAWNASSDATSGVQYYQLELIGPTGRINGKQVLAGQSLEWAPVLAGLPTGSYTLRGLVVDNAGNSTAWKLLYTFRYDGTPPLNPNQSSYVGGAVINDVWQSSQRTPNFVWSGATDEGSGIKDTALYWGNDPNGEASTYQTSNAYQSATPLCAVADTCVGYLRLRSRDNVNNIASKWATVFVMRYDNTPPVVSAFSINNGVSSTAQTQVTLRLSANDGLGVSAGSGVNAMRFSTEGTVWSDWEAFQPERQWQLPSISRQTWHVFAQVRDRMGLVSQPISASIYFDVNPRQPHSESYRMFTQNLNAGAGEATSVQYRGRGTLGQVMDSASISSTNYVLQGGYEAAALALPIVEPSYVTYTYINGAFASGSTGEIMTSTLYRSIGVLGEPGLPSNVISLTSGNYQLAPGFLAASALGNVDLGTPISSGVAPALTAGPLCADHSVTINSGAMFAAQAAVALRLCAPNAVSMLISNDPSFVDATWQPFTQSVAWNLLVGGNYAVQRSVYVKFKDDDGRIHETFSDDITLDPIAPTGGLKVGNATPVLLLSEMFAKQRAKTSEVDVKGIADTTFITIGQARYASVFNGQRLAQPLIMLSPNAAGGVELFVEAEDAVSGVSEIQLADSEVFSNTWETYNYTKTWAASGNDGIKTLYLRFRDSAGNVSAVVSDTFILDRGVPVGGMVIDPRVVGKQAISVTVYLGADDATSQIMDMRVSSDSTFSAVAWQPFTPSVSIPISYANASTLTIYAQFRDMAGNESPISHDTLTFDTTSPVMYAEAAKGGASANITVTRAITVYSYDDLSAVTLMHISNDPRLIDNVVTKAYTETLIWVFDTRRVAWIQLEDSFGNKTTPFPVYAGDDTRPILTRAFIPNTRRVAPSGW